MSNIYNIAVYQNGITTTVVLAEFIQIREIVVQSDTGTIISNKEYPTNFYPFDSSGFFLTANFLIIPLPDQVLVY